MRRLPGVLILLSVVLSGCVGLTFPLGTPSTRPSTSAARSVDPDSGLPWVNLADLPQQAQRVYAQIATDGPFAFSKDGSTFLNAERVLPRQPRGYYREYTVASPGANNRGAKRIVCGGQDRTSRDDCYYTSDHYQSFRRIKP